jgi:hypothetical protein
MKILYVTDVNYVGKFKEDFSFGYRPFMSWVPALDAVHCSYYRLNELDIDFKFDIAIIGSLNSTLLNPNIIDLKTLILDKIKKISKKIIFHQESYHRSFTHDVGVFKKTNQEIVNYYFDFLTQCDAFLVHNKIDAVYFGELFNKPSFVHPQLIIPVEEIPNLGFDKPNNFGLSSFGGLQDKGGSMDGYLLVKDFNYPIYCFGDVGFDLPLLEPIPYDQDYRSFNQKLSEKIKIGINVPHLPIGGSFPLQCAMNKIPCVGWSNGDPQQDCFPDLISDYPNFNKLKIIIKKLLNERNFYVDQVEKGYENFINKYSFDSYINQINTIFSSI